MQIALKDNPPLVPASVSSLADDMYFDTPTAQDRTPILPDDSLAYIFDGRKTRGNQAFRRSSADPLFTDFIELTRLLISTVPGEDKGLAQAALSVVPPVDPAELMDGLKEFEPFAPWKPILDVGGSFLSLVDFARSMDSGSLPFVAYDPLVSQPVVYRNSMLLDGQGSAVGRRRRLKRAVIRLKQPWWRKGLAVGLLLFGAGLSLFTPLTGAILAAARISQRLGGFVTTQVPEAWHVEPEMNAEELGQLTRLTYAYQLSQRRR